jgi:peptidoglycan hydrolase-like protein with peptidoglycan-binding domain
VSKDLATHVQYTNKLKAASEFTGSVDPAPPADNIASLINPEPLVQAANEPGKSELPPAAIAKGTSLAPAINAKIMRIKSVQIALSSMGYPAGKVTGSLNEATKSAILKFEMDNGLAMDGVVDAKLLEALQITADN